jgi:hypothetical protein
MGVGECMGIKRNKSAKSSSQPVPRIWNSRPSCLCLSAIRTHHFPGKMPVPSQECVVFQLFRWLKTQIIILFYIKNQYFSVILSKEFPLKTTDLYVFYLAGHFFLYLKAKWSTLACNVIFYVKLICYRFWN